MKGEANFTIILHFSLFADLFPPTMITHWDLSLSMKPRMCHNGSLELVYAEAASLLQMAC